MLSCLLRSFFILSLLFATHARAEPLFWRGVWEDQLLDDKTHKLLTGAARKERLQLLEDAYGAKLIVMPDDDNKIPVRPRKVPGVAFHSSSTQAKYFIGDQNPQLLSNKDIRRLEKDYGLKDLDEKWDEYRFLKQFAPEIAPPEMHLATDYTDLPPTAEEIQEASTKLATVLANLDGTPNEQVGLRQVIENHRNQFIRLLTIQKRINETPSMGRSILKERDANHSEGRLPITDKDWGKLYAHYLLETKHQITDDTGADDLLELPYVEGRILDLMLSKNAKSVIVQHMSKLKKEFRVHIVDSTVLKGTSPLRFYHLNTYGTQEEREKIYNALERYVLSRLRAKGFNHYQGSPDMAILEDGSVQILDFNDGAFSGYLSPYEDLFTANLFAEHYTGKKTRFLKEFEAITELAFQDQRAAFKSFGAKYKRFMEGDAYYSLFDRISEHLLKEIDFRPTPERYEEALEIMKAAGLTRRVPYGERLYMKFISELQDKHADLVLPKEKWGKWVSFLNSIEPEIITYMDKTGHFLDAEMPDVVGENSCLVLRKVGMIRAAAE